MILSAMGVIPKPTRPSGYGRQVVKRLESYKRGTDRPFAGLIAIRHGLIWAVVMMTAAPAAAATVTGVWVSEDMEMTISISRCQNGALCATLISLGDGTA